MDILPNFNDPDNHHIFVSLGCAPENLAPAVGTRNQIGQLFVSFSDMPEAQQIKWNYAITEIEAK